MGETVWHRYRRILHSVIFNNMRMPRGTSWESRSLKTIINIKSAAALLSVLTKDSVIYFLNLIIPGVLEMWILQLR